MLKKNLYHVNVEQASEQWFIGPNQKMNASHEVSIQVVDWRWQRENKRQREKKWVGLPVSGRQKKSRSKKLQWGKILGDCRVKLMMFNKVWLMPLCEDVQKIFGCSSINFKVIRTRSIKKEISVQVESWVHEISKGRDRTKH